MAKTLSHGGNRKGSGRKKLPPVDYDDKFKKDVLSTLSKLAKKHDASFLEKVFEMMYNEKVQDTVKASLFKTYKEIFVSKTPETKVEVSQVTGPGIMLPTKKPDPSEKIE